MICRGTLPSESIYWTMILWTKTVFNLSLVGTNVLDLHYLFFFPLHFDGWVKSPSLRRWVKVSLQSKHSKSMLLAYSLDCWTLITTASKLMKVSTICALSYTICTREKLKICKLTFFYFFYKVDEKCWWRIIFRATIMT